MGEAHTSMRRRGRRALAKPAAALASAVLLAACGGSSGGSPSASAGSAGSSGSSTSSVNVGVATTLSGTFAAFGGPGLDGIKLAVDQINQSGGLLGKKLNLVKGDDQIDPGDGRDGHSQPDSQ